MTYKLLTKLTVFSLISLLFGCTSPLHQGLDLGDPASIANAPSSAVVTDGSGMKVSAIPLKKTVELGEPVYLSLLVTNTGREPQKIIGGLRPGNGLIEVYLLGGDKEKTLLPPLSKGDFSGATTLSPKQTTGSVFPIFFGGNGWSFKKEGEYRIVVQLQIPVKDGFSSFTSEPAIINVKPSAAGKALISGDGRASVEAGKFLLWRSGDHLEAGIKYLTQLSRQYPDSALSSYITSARAQNYSEPFANYIAKEIRVPDCKQASALRKKVKTTVLAENVVIEDYISQAKCNAEMKRWKEAGDALDAGYKLSKDRPEFRVYYQSIAEMQKILNQFL